MHSSVSGYISLFTSHIFVLGKVRIAPLPKRLHLFPAIFLQKNGIPLLVGPMRFFDGL
jgi:hypothetical protein